MANEVTYPLLPCGSIDEIRDFSLMLGFEVTHWQRRPNPSVVLRREDFPLHFFGLDDFDPERSSGNCLVFFPDAGALHADFAQGMRATHGRPLVTGTGPARRRVGERQRTDDSADGRPPGRMIPANGEAVKGHGEQRRRRATGNRGGDGPAVGDRGGK